MVSIKILPLPTIDQLDAYLRASVQDLDRPDWDADVGILELCEEPVARAYLALRFWEFDETDETPSLDEVFTDSLATDFLVHASDSEKSRIREWVLSNYNLKP